MSRTNNIGAVAMGNTGFKPSKFPFTHDVNTTASLGDYQPILCRPVVPGSKSVLGWKNLIWLDSVVSPVWGDIRGKGLNYFVAYSDLSRNVASLLSQTAVARGSGDILYNTQLPHVVAADLFYFLLEFAKCSIFLSEDDGLNWKQPNDESEIGRLISGNIPTYQPDPLDPTTVPKYVKVRNDFTDKIFHDLYDLNYSSLPFASVTEHHNLAINVRQVFYGDNTLTHDHYVALDARYIQHLLYSNDDRAANLNPNACDFLLQGWEDIKIQYTGDGDVPDVSKTYKVLYCFNMSDYGKRLWKVFKGAEIQPNFLSNEYLSILPLLGIYKAYYESNGLLLYTNWEQTNAARLLAFYDNTGTANFQEYFYESNTSLPDFAKINPLLRGFMQDIGSMWATESQDFVSSITKSPNVNPAFSLSGFLNRIVGNEGQSSQNDMIAGGAASGESPLKSVSTVPYTKSINHDFITSDLLKRVAQRVNRDTIAGKRVEEILRERGMGSYYDTMKPRFIGSFETPIQIDAVTSSSDTFKRADGGVEGMRLGERGGKGMGYSSSRKRTTYKNDEFGLIITLFAILPSAGWTQQRNIAWECINLHDFYDPMFDAEGYEAVKKNQLFDGINCYLFDHEMPNVAAHRAASSATMGFAPISSRHKIQGNVVSGECSMRSRRSASNTYFLDKIIDLGEVQGGLSVIPAGGGETHDFRLFNVNSYFREDMLNIAGLAWRYVARYVWMNNFDRIFDKRTEDPMKLDNFIDFMQAPEDYEFTSRNDDHFICQFTCELDVYAPMLPISDSYMTREDGNEGKISTNVSKA